MDYNRSVFTNIVWMDSFLFFYWDIRRYRPAVAENVDRLVVDYFQQQEPSITSGYEPSSWDKLLCHLADMTWDLKPTQSKFTDTTGLRTDYAKMPTGDPRGRLQPLLLHINTAYEHGREEPLQWLNTWKGNPFLDEFGYAHRSEHWTLPLPTHVDRILTLAWKYESESFMCDSYKCRKRSCQSRITRFNLFPTARLERSFRLVLQHTASGDMAQLRPCYSSDRYCIPIHGQSPDGYEFRADTRMINLGKRIFTSMLFWVDEMCRTGRLLSLCDILDRQLEEWPHSDAEDTLRVNYELWAAIRNFGLRPVSTKGEVWSDGADTPTKSETLSATG